MCVKPNKIEEPHKQEDSNNLRGIIETIKGTGL